MFRFGSHSRPEPRVKPLVCLGLSWLLAVGTWTVVAPALAKPRPQAARVMQKPDPDTLLIEVYKELGTGHLREAMKKADALVEAYPNFRLGQLIRGDLLLMHDRPVTILGAVQGGPEDQLRSLREEAMVRLRSLRERPDPELIPRPILQLREDQKHVLVVDTRRSRLYVYENKGGRPHFLTDYYVSHGKFGVNKIKEGDQKTPIGIYYITARLPGARLPDFYGSGALPINYPNEWDRINGRSGSGIWLHGTPSDSFSRPPLSSDGCVVLTNPDLHKLFSSVEIGRTPVVIAENVEFVNKARWDNERSAAARLIDEWRQAAESMNPARLMANYSSRFKSERGEDLATWFARQQASFSGARAVSIRLRDVTYFFYPGREDLIVSTFTEEAQIGKSRSTSRKRQYWAKEGNGWKIIYELNI